VNIGLSVNIRELGTGTVWLLIAVVTVAILGKLFGAGLGARLAGFSWLESAQLGAGMVSRGRSRLDPCIRGLERRIDDCQRILRSCRHGHPNHLVYSTASSLLVFSGNHSNNFAVYSLSKENGNVSHFVRSA
jgi:hypothetical protein